MLRVLVRNMLSNCAGFTVHSAVAFFLTPFVLHTLGDARYGAWLLVTSLTGYYGLVAFGLRPGVAQYLTRYLIARDFKKLNRIASTAVATLAGCGLLVVVAACVLAAVAPIVFDIKGHLVHEARWCILTIGMSTAFGFSLLPFGAVFTATQRYDLSNAIGISTRLLTALGAVIMLKLGFGLLGLCVVVAAGNLIGSVVRWRVAYRILPELHVSADAVQWRAIYEIATYGAWAWVISSAQRLLANMHLILIGVMLPLAAVTPFGLAVSIVNCFARIFTPIGTVFFPAMTQCDVQRNLTGLREMYLLGSKGMYLLAVVVGIISVFFSADFFRLWIGQQTAYGTPFAPVHVLYNILIVSAIATAGQRIGYQVLLGTRKLRGFATVAILEVVANLVVIATLIRFAGLIGIAVGTAITAVVFQGMVQPWLVCRLLDVRLAEYLRKVLARPVVVAAAVFGLLLMLRQPFPNTYSWHGLILCGGIVGSIGCAMAVTFGLTSDERERFISRPLRAVADRYFLHAALKRPDGGHSPPDDPSS